MILYISVFGIFLSLLLIYNNAKRYPSIIYLGVCFLLLSLYGVNQYAVISSQSVILIAIMSTNLTFLYYLIGPMSYLYIRSVLTNDARLRKVDIVHFLPMLIYLIAALPHIFSSYSYKAQLAQSIISDPNFLGSYHFTILTDWLTSAGVYISRVALVLIYLLVSGMQILRYCASERGGKYKDANCLKKSWLFTFLGFQLVLILSHLIYLVNSFSVFWQFSSSFSAFLYLLSALTLIGLIVSPLLFPQILYGKLNTPNIINDKPSIVENVASKQLETIKTKCYDEEYMLLLQQKVEDAMKDNKLFLQKEFNLPQLSVFIQVPNHHLIYFFTNYKQQSFNDYRNEFRIRYAKLLISQNQSETITLEAIGLMSGFSNRNSFAKAFKEIEGVTPHVFAVQNKK